MAEQKKSIIGESIDRLKKTTDEGKSKIEKAIEEGARAYMESQKKYLPQILELEKLYRPQFQAMNLADARQFGLGLMGLMPQFTQGAERQLSAARSAELGRMKGQAGLVRGLMDRLSPEQAREVDRMQRLAQLGEKEIGAYNQRAQSFLGKYGIGTQATDTASQMAQQMANEAYARRGTLSPEEQRMTQQMAREASAASGRIGGAGSVASEVLNREQAMAARRAEAAQMAGQSSALGRQAAEQRMAGFGQMQDVERQRMGLRGMAGESAGQAFGAAGQFYTQPGLSLLSATPLSYQIGQQQLGLGLGAIGAGTPQMINADTLTNIGMQGYSNMMAQKNAETQASASKKAGMMAAGGAVAGATIIAI